MKRLSMIMACALLSTTASADSSNEMTLHRLYCGDIHVSFLNAFSDTDNYTGQEKSLTDSCYVVKSGDNILLWDTGLSESIADKEGGISSPPFTLTVKSKITDELAKIGLKPEDITHVGISHAHFDHTGNANLFTNATLVIQKIEWDTLKNAPEIAEKHHMPLDSLSIFLNDESKVKIIDGDADLFGDGSVKAISLPGHTPGHMALKVTLPESGVYILSGDQWHFNENHENNGVPTFNYDRADTLSSSDKLDKLIKNTGATLIIQHEPKDISKIPELPEGLK